MTRAIQKILVANRGEIAVRIMRTVKKMGIMTVAVFSDEDANSLHKNLADEAYPIGGGALTGTYLNIDKLIQIAKHSHAGAIHPGYGFLSESPDFALACEQNNIIFIGPSSKVIQLMGNKIEARNIAKEIGIPVTESIEGSQDDLLKKEITIPYPLLIKAAAGGGGKGMKIVNHPAELKENLESASREALNYFGDGTVFIEKYVENPRHIEVQLLADNHGNCIHLFERECSIQRRHQKIIEEAPSPTFTEEVREKITSSAIGIAQKIGYTNAGTIEFLVDKDLNFYFLEMNTRIQVEHPVTEMITGLDIVEEQIEIATGKPLHYKQTDIHSKGHAIECRIYAENPASSFLPSPGEIVLYKTPVYKGIRIDSSIDGQAEIRSEFDPMIAKLISNGTDREDARIKMLKALDGFFLQGIESNISYLKEIMEHQVFIENSISTSFCDVYTSGILSNLNKKKENFPSEIVIGGFLLFELSNQQKNNLWERIGFWRDLMQISLKIDPFPFEVEIKEIKENEVKYVINNLSFKTLLLGHSAGEIKYLVNDRFYHAAFSSKNSYQSFATINGLNFIIERQHVFHSDVLYETSESQHSDSGNMIQAPMFGKLVKISVNEGDLVKKNQTLLVIEAMKMENNIISHKDATVESIHAKAGQMIEINQILISFSE